VVGETAGSHGVYRPGGSALNAGQVGSARAALYAAKRRTAIPADEKVFSILAEKAVSEMSALADAVIAEDSNIKDCRHAMSGLMSTYAGAIRDSAQIEKALKEVRGLAADLGGRVRISKPYELRWVYRLRDMLIAMQCCMTAMTDYTAHGGKSRGSALYTDVAGKKPYARLPDIFTFSVDDGALDEDIQTVRYSDGVCTADWRKRRPIPENDDFFEVVWKSYRETGNID
jgi:succinate dehydrogenase/fumarate reductase flavoprotein subunit